LTKKLKLSVQRRLSKYGGIKMNLAFALKSYNETKVSKDMANGDGYEAVKFALKQAIASMEKLNLDLSNEEREHHFERALSCIYFLQKCLDFDKGGDLAKNLFKVYEYCRNQIISVNLKDNKDTLDNSIEFAQTILDGWEGIKPEV
tara:strand:+ start:227 stop:664 length:438 start_codon:yes stop_codon:yes gene_type:complete